MTQRSLKTFLVLVYDQPFVVRAGAMAKISNIRILDAADWAELVENLGFPTEIFHQAADDAMRKLLPAAAIMVVEAGGLTLDMLLDFVCIDLDGLQVPSITIHKDKLGLVDKDATQVVSCKREDAVYAFTVLLFASVAEQLKTQNQVLVLKSYNVDVLLSAVTACAEHAAVSDLL